MATTEIRYGVIGTGMMGCEHLRDIAALPGAVAVAVADPHPASLEAARAAAGSDIATYDAPAALLERDDLDAVVIASPNHTHHEVLDQIWGRDLHVLVEKPLCTTLADCLDVRARAVEHPGIVWVGLEYRYIDAVARLLDEVRAGTAGRPWTLSIREHRFPFLRKVGDWNRFTRNSGGTLVEKCCHFFDLMNLVLPGRPVRVMASGAQDVNHLDERYDGEVPDILDNAFVVVEYAGGERALLDLCMFAEGSRWEQELVVVGDAGKVEARTPGFMEAARGRRAEVVVGSRGPDWPVREDALDTAGEGPFAAGHHGASYREHVGFVAAIRAGTAPGVSVDEGVRSVAMGVAAHRSIDEQRVVELDELGLPADLWPDT